MEPKEKKNLTQTTTNSAALEEYGIICIVTMTKTLILHNTAKLGRYPFIIPLQHQAVASLLYLHQTSHSSPQQHNSTSPEGWI